MQTRRELHKGSFLETGCTTGLSFEMKSDIDWNRYGVVHWTANRLSVGGEVGRCGQTQAFAKLAEAVRFATGLDRAYRQTARVDCGGKTYHAIEVGRLAARSDFQQLRELTEA